MSVGNVDLLRSVSPFRYLYKSHLAWLSERAEDTTLDAGAIVYRRGDPDHRVLFVVSGAVEFVDTKRAADESVLVVTTGRYFGEWEAVFHEPRRFTVRTVEPSTLLIIRGDDFIGLVRQSPAFAQSLSTLLRDNQGIFHAFDRFKVALLQNVNQGHVGIGELLPLYRRLKPALHSGANDEDHLDLGALLYAVRRLPENVTRTFAFLLLDELPIAYPDPDRYFPTVKTAARRRDVWEMLPGKDLVLLRSGDSDLIDLISAMCVYSVEARKIRERIQRAVDVELLDEFASGEISSPDAVRGFLNRLPFSSREVRGIMNIWPQDSVRRIGEIARHREMFSVDVRRQQRNHNSRRSELWTKQIATVAEELFGRCPGDLSDEYRVHIISSNTHSIANCLNPWFDQEAHKILDWGKEERSDLCSEEWLHQRDLVYALSRDYFSENPVDDARRKKIASESGITHLGRTASTGVQVQIIELDRLRGKRIDPDLGLSAKRQEKADVLVNIDYAFGEQAEYIIRDLLLLFGRNVHSVNFFGKAGALVGRRGDILVPTAFVEQSTDFFQPLAAATRLHPDRLREQIGAAKLHFGPLLTVDGTLLQNRRMLNFYRHIWSVVGIEMEGTHYHRQILESQQLGVAKRQLDQRFFYYVSDLPLEASGRLTDPLKASEGVPPLYAITRHILQEIIDTGSDS